MSPYAFFQFWLNIEDATVGQMLRVFSFRSRAEIEALEESARERPQLREAQRALAREVTTLVHGAEAAARVEEASQALFGRGELSALDAATLRDATAELPSVVVKRVGGAPLPSVLELFTETGLVASRSAARRAIVEGGAYVNNVRVTDEGQVPGDGDLLAGRWLLLRRGKRHLAAVEVVEAGAEG